MAKPIKRQRVSEAHWLDPSQRVPEGREIFFPERCKVHARLQLSVVSQLLKWN